MALMKLVTYATLLVAAYAVPVHESHSYGRYGPVTTLADVPAVRYSYAPASPAHGPAQVDLHAPPQYEFKYAVKDPHTHDIKEQAEKRVGDQVEGYYSLVEPDGTTRTVHYTADQHNGFNAVVSKSGHAVHPAAPVHHAAPVHTAPAAPSYSRATPLVSYSHVPSYQHAIPLASYSHAAPAVSYTNTVGHRYTTGGLGHGYGAYH